MKLVETVMLRDEVDVIDAQISYHLSSGVDFVIAIDHDSRDGTSDILESYARDGHLVRIPKAGKMQESVWRTEMARLAATEYGADWVLNTDADEFWMARDGGLLREVFAAIPERFGVVWALTRHFVPRPENEPHFADRMTVRVSTTAPVNDPTSPYRPHAKVAHRADPSIVVRYGAHLVSSRLNPLSDWYLADVLHFPYRSLEQYLRKSLRRAHGDLPLGQYVRAAEASAQGRAERSSARSWSTTRPWNEDVLPARSLSTRVSGTRCGTASGSRLATRTELGESSTTSSRLRPCARPTSSGCRVGSTISARGSRPKRRP